MRLLVTAIGAVAITIAACASTQQAALPVPLPPPQPEEEDPNAQSIDSGFLLSPAEEKALQLRAESGDRDAAFRLSFHFVSAGSREKADYWQRIAAGNGHPVAQYNLWAESHGKQDCTSMREALGWLEAAAQRGQKEAQGELAAYRSAVRSCSP